MFLRFLPDIFTLQVDDKEYEDNENSTDDEEFVCDNDENDVIILEFSVIVVGNITWILWKISRGKVTKFLQVTKFFPDLIFPRLSFPPTFFSR